MPRALLALSIGAFGIGCTEFILMGLLPQIASDVHATVPAMGMLITAYAVGVLIGAPTLTMLGSRLSARQTLITLMGVFVAGNLVSALAPNYTVLLLARLLTSLAHGSFFGVGAIAARRAVPAERSTQAISLMFVGLTIANIVGVPVGTWVGQHLSWRYVFVGIAAVGVLTILALRAFLPADRFRIDMRAEIGSFRLPQVWIGLGITAIGFGSMFAVASYITPILTDLTGLGGTGVTVALALFGIGTTVGTLAGGKFGDRWGRKAVAGGMLAVAVVLTAFSWTATSPVAAVVTLVVFGMVSYSLGPIVQNSIIEAAGTGGSLVSAANQGAFNVANALGASLGALVINQGLGLRAPMWVGVGLSLAGAAMVCWAMVNNRRNQHSAGSSDRRVAQLTA